MLLSGLLLACGAGALSSVASKAPKAGADTAPADTSESAARAALSQILTEAYADAPAGVDGIRLLVHDDDGIELLDLEVGTLPRGEALAVASASKLVSALVLLRIVEEGALALSDRVDARVPSPGAYGAVTLDQLGGFVSGLPAHDNCLREARSSVADCAARLLSTTPAPSRGPSLTTVARTFRWPAGWPNSPPARTGPRSSSAPCASPSG
jgi:CubicO group peptidase (beta-lactamase class C family)